MSIHRNPLTPALLLAVALAASSTTLPASPQPQAAPHAAPKPSAKPAAAPTPQAAKPNAPLLPDAFSGWNTTAAPQPVTDPAQADAANAAALKEYGFTDALLATYTRGSETLKIKALRFVDASGAYGAYSFYRHSGWPREEIGSGATSDNNRVLFWTGNILVDSGFSHISAMSASELRDLASSIPVPTGNKSLPPPILGDLPQKNLDGQTAHYALGPAGYTGPSGIQEPLGVLPVELVSFDRGAEAVTATYTLSSNPATLTIINYPTPQMAAAQAKAISAYLKAGNTLQHPFTKALQESNPSALEIRRSGPLVAIVSGDAIPDQARKLLAQVHFEADTSAIQGEAINPVQNFAKLIIGIIVLVVVMFLVALAVALFLGGGRAAFRVLRGKPASSMYDDDFTRLDLTEDPSTPPATPPR